MHRASRDPAGLRDSSLPAQDRTDQLVEIQQESPGWRRGIDRLRDLAAGSRRNGYAHSTGPLTRYSWSELKDLASEGAASNLSGRRRAWKHGRWTEATSDGNRHVREYLRGCGTLATRYLRDERLAGAIHNFVTKGTGYRPAVPPELRSGMPPFSGPIASAIYALYTGASHAAGATALRLRRDRALPVVSAADAPPPTHPIRVTDPFTFER